MDTIDTTPRRGSGAAPSAGREARTLTVAVVGGTGTLGRLVAAMLADAGHQVRALSRHSDHPVDLTTGAGLAAGLSGCDVVVDASGSSGSSKVTIETLVDGSRRLLDAEATAGVTHHVSVSIVGCELVGVAYLDAKAAQQRIVEAGPVPWSTVRATQFHDFVVTTLASATRAGLVLAPQIRVQPVSASEVARVVARVATLPPSGAAVTVAGPEVRELRDLARVWKRAAGRRALVVPVVLPGRTGRALSSGALTTDAPDVVGSTTFEQWLAAPGRDGVSARSA